MDLKQTTFGKCQVMILVKYKILKGTQNKRQEVLKLRGLNTGMPNAIVTAVTGKGQSCCSGRMPKGGRCLETSRGMVRVSKTSPEPSPVFPEKEGNE